jgi:hypothetical protein
MGLAKVGNSPGPLSAVLKVNCGAWLAIEVDNTERPVRVEPRGSLVVAGMAANGAKLPVTQAPRNGKCCPRLWENAQEPTRRRIVFSIALLLTAATALFVSTLTKLRRTFYAQIECVCFHTAWPHTCRSQYSPGSAQLGGRRPFPTRVARDALRQKGTIGGLKILRWGRSINHHVTRRELLGLRI